MLSRMAALYLENLLFVGLWMLPANAAAQFFSIAPAPALWLSFLPVMLFFPLLPAFFAALCGFLFAWTQARQHKNALLGSLLTMLLLCVILFFCLQADRLAELLFTNRDGLLHILDTYLFPLRLVSDGICGSFPALTGGLFLCALPYAAFAALLSRYYKRILSALQARTLRHDFSLSALQQSRPFCALLKSELYRLTRSSLYLTNTCFGIVFLTGITFFLLFSRERLDMLLPLTGGPRLLTPMLFLAAMFFLSTVYPSCISISLDGKALWLLKEAPLPAPVLFGAKACLNLVHHMARLPCQPPFARSCRYHPAFRLVFPAPARSVCHCVLGSIRASFKSRLSKNRLPKRKRYHQKFRFRRARNLRKYAVRPAHRRNLGAVYVCPLCPIAGALPYPVFQLFRTYFSLLAYAPYLGYKKICSNRLTLRVSDNFAACEYA